MDRGSFHRNDHMGNIRKWKPPPPAPFLQSSSGLDECLRVPGPPPTSPSHRELMGCQLQLEGSSLLFHHVLRSSLNGGKPAALPGQAPSDTAGEVMHYKWELDSLTFTGVIFFIQNWVCYHVNLSGFCTLPGHEAMVFPSGT